MVNGQTLRPTAASHRVSKTKKIGERRFIRLIDFVILSPVVACNHILINHKAEINCFMRTPRDQSGQQLLEETILHVCVM